MIKVLFIGPVGDYKIIDGGYGNAATGMYYIFKKLEEKGLVELELISTIQGQFKFPDKKEYDISITAAHPNSFLNVNNDSNFRQIYKICTRNYLSVVWETEPLPTNWNYLWDGDLFTGFLAPSHFILNQLKKLTKKPLFYYPHFINKDIFTPIDIEEKIKEQYFTVLFIGQYTARKGMEDAIISYVRSISTNTDCKLILKYHAMSTKELHPENFIKYLNSCNSAKHTTNSIYSLESFLTSEDLIKLYKQTSLLLMCSRGEGFGIPCVENQLVGIPITYTNWSSLPEVAEAEGNYPIDYFLDEAINMSHHGYENFTSYARPSIRSIMNNLIKAYAFWKKDKRAYYESVSQNRQLSIDKFGEEAITRYITNILEDGKSSNLKVVK